MPPQERIAELEATIDSMQDAIATLRASVLDLQEQLDTHDHSLNVGDSKPTENSIRLKTGQGFQTANSGLYGITPEETPGPGGAYQLLLPVGEDGSSGVSEGRTTNTQINVQHIPDSLSFCFGFRNIYQEFNVGFSSNSTTITSNQFTFEPDELEGQYINLYTEAGVFGDSVEIAGNNTSTIELNSAPSFSASNGYYSISKPVLLGSADWPWRRAYVMEGTFGGVRFGNGPTGQGKNGLLYMNASGNLIWRDKSGGTTQLN